MGFGQALAFLVASGLCYLLITKGKYHFDTAAEAEQIRKMVVGRAFAAAVIYLGTLVVVFDFNLIIK